MILLAERPFFALTMCHWPCATFSSTLSENMQQFSSNWTENLLHYTAHNTTCIISSGDEFSHGSLFGLPRNAQVILIGARWTKHASLLGYQEFWPENFRNTPASMNYIIRHEAEDSRPQPSSPMLLSNTWEIRHGCSVLAGSPGCSTLYTQ